MSTSTHNIAIRGKDQTATAFQSIQARALAAGNRISKVMGGALAAAGAYLSVRAIKGGIDELSHLSDIAMKANTTSGELMQLSQALGVLGIQGANVDSLARSFSLMEKNTGRSGLAGFYETIGEIGKIEDVSKRGQEAVKAFGRSGLDFMPLINAAENGTAALQGVVGAFGTISEASANAADDIADGVSELTGTFKTLWLEALGTVAQWVSGDFGGSFRQSMMALSAWISYWAKNVGDILLKPFLAFQKFFTSFYSALGALGGSIYEGLFGSGGTWGDVWDNVSNAYMDEWRELGIEYDNIDERMQKRADELAARLEAARNFQANYEGAAKNTGARNAASPEAATQAAAERAVRISNGLIEGGSNASRRLSLLGPDYQNEQKKQTDLLKKIAENTQQTADNTEGGDSLYQETDLGA
jgi:hypothetical protein